MHIRQIFGSCQSEDEDEDEDEDEEEDENDKDSEGEGGGGGYDIEGQCDPAAGLASRAVVAEEGVAAAGACAVRIAKKDRYFSEERRRLTLLDGLLAELGLKSHRSKGEEGLLGSIVCMTAGILCILNWHILGGERRNLGVQANSYSKQRAHPVCSSRLVSAPQACMYMYTMWGKPSKQEVLN
jgi:hypothetical protein